MSENHSGDPGAPKTAKNNRFRRNIRILAVCVAAYYFISAGWSWYEEREERKTRVDPAISSVFELNAPGALDLASRRDPAQFSELFGESTEQGLSRCRALRTASEGTLCLEEQDGRLIALVVSVRDADRKDPALSRILRLVIGTAENQLDERPAAALMEALGLNEDARPPESGIREARSQKNRYQLEYPADGGFRLVISAL